MSFCTNSFFIDLGTLTPPIVVVKLPRHIHQRAYFKKLTPHLLSLCNSIILSNHFQWRAPIHPLLAKATYRPPTLVSYITTYVEFSTNAKRPSES